MRYTSPIIDAIRAGDPGLEHGGKLMLYLEARMRGRVVRWPLRGNSLIVGRQNNCDLVVEAQSVSRRHLRVTLEGGKAHVEDLGSRHGLWLDGSRVNEIDVRSGEWFHCGVIPMVIREGITLSSSVGPASGEDSAPKGVPAYSTMDSVVPRGAPPSPDDVLRRLADCVGVDVEPETMLERLLGVLVDLSSARGAALLGCHAGGWSIHATSGKPLPPAVESCLLQGGVLAGENNLDGLEFLALPIEFGGSESCWLAVYPWTCGARSAPLAEFVAALCARQLSQDLEDHAGIDVTAGAKHGPTVPAASEVFVAVSPAGKRLLAEVDRLAQTDLPILLSGESGTGKELLARKLHDRSLRSAGPFVAINCAALPQELLEAELFGIEKGVATGVSARSGWFARATEGTILLDEIGDMPLALQPKLLRALENRQIVPLGAPAPVPIDVRIIAASHRDLDESVQAKLFRADLLYRLAGARVTAPPLRERIEDILPLARRFARQAAKEQGQSFAGIDLDAARLLLGYDWPGNVRELQHAVARSVALSDGPILHAALLPPEIRQEADQTRGDTFLGLSGNWRTARERFDRLYFEQLLERCDGNLSEASRIAGLARSNLYRRLKELSLR